MAAMHAVQERTRTVHASQRAQVQSLAALGVRPASGRGKPGHIAVTLIALLSVPLVLVWLAPANPLLWGVLPLAVLLVDFLSGLVHWLFDNRIRPGTGLVGRIAVNFLDHHVHPRRSADVGFAATTWRVALYVSLPLLAAALLVTPGGWAQAWLFWLGALSLVVAQTHKEAHKRQPAAMVRWLQRWHLSLSPGAHRRHHRHHEQAYCVFTGWWNPLLDRIGFWRALERVVDFRPGRRRASPRGGNPTASSER
jgi:ubiquitin-conjugating enzyme E2 variant